MTYQSQWKRLQVKHLSSPQTHLYRNQSGKRKTSNATTWTTQGNKTEQKAVRNQTALGPRAEVHDVTSQGSMTRAITRPRDPNLASVHPKYGRFQWQCSSSIPLTKAVSIFNVIELVNYVISEGKTEQKTATKVHTSVKHERKVWNNQTCHTRKWMIDIVCTLADNPVSYTHLRAHETG